MNRENGGVYKAIIVGAGASGIVASIGLQSKFSNCKISLFEKLDRACKKLLVTGNGQCNLTNESVDVINFHSAQQGFCNHVIEKYGNKRIISFFENLGVPCVVDGGKVFPMSKQASSVVDALRFKLQSAGVELYSSTEIVSAKKVNGVFEVKDNNGKTYTAENLIISVGGQAQKHLGTDGRSYALLESFGHKKTKLFPSIVQLKCDTQKIKGLKGLKQKAKLTAIVNGNSVKSFTGDLLFTEFGISGNSVFNLSPYLVDKQNALISVDFCPDITLEGLTSLIKRKQKDCSYLSGEYLLSGVMNNKIAFSVLKSLGYNLNQNITKYNAENIASQVKNFTLKVTGGLGFDNAQVTKGGISTVDFDDKTMQSKLVKGLYAIGEVLDVDGDCGGYNLTWAFNTAFCVIDGIN